MPGARKTGQTAKTAVNTGGLGKCNAQDQGAVVVLHSGWRPTPRRLAAALVSLIPGPIPAIGRARADAANQGDTTSKVIKS